MVHRALPYIGVKVRLMRIVAGQLGGRIIHEPHGHKTHPMSEKVRGALFNALGDVGGLTFLDAFAGSGALSLEAASRGAAKVTAVEKDRTAYSVIVKNIKELKVGDIVHAVHANVSGWSIHNMERRFDIVLLDPPYDDLHLPVLQKLINRHIKKGGLAVLSWPGKKDLPKLERVELVENKHYGDTQLAFYRKK